MASAHFYGMCRWILHNAEYKKAVEVEVTVASGVQYSDHASEDKPTPAEGDPVVWHVTFPNSDDFATMLDGSGPVLPPHASDIFTFCHQTAGGQTEICNWHMSVNQTWIDEFLEWLAYWFPALHTQVVAIPLTTSMTRAQVIDAVSAIIQPGVPQIAE